MMILSSAEIASSPVIVQPGQPGSASKIIDAQTAIDIADTSYTLDDVLFLQQMIPHHEQAILLSTLAPDRTNSESILDLAKRIESSQHDEILFMKDWLGSRGEESHHIKMSNHHMKMMGMATKTQI